jgi:WD40 repeat protein
MGQLLFLSGGTVDHPLSELDVDVVTKVIALWEAARLGWGVNKVELSHLLSGAGVDSALADQLWPALGLAVPEDRIDSLGFFAVALLMGRRGAAAQRVRALFALFDVDRAGAMRADELTVLALSCCWTLHRVVGAPGARPSADLESQCIGFAKRVMAAAHGERAGADMGTARPSSSSAAHRTIRKRAGMRCTSEHFAKHALDAAQPVLKGLRLRLLPPNAAETAAAAAAAAVEEETTRAARAGADAAASASASASASAAPVRKVDDTVGGGGTLVDVVKDAAVAVVAVERETASHVSVLAPESASDAYAHWIRRRIDADRDGLLDFKTNAEASGAAPGLPKWTGALGWMRDATAEHRFPSRYSVDLEWVFGYRTHDCHTNAQYLRDGRAAWHTAAIAVIYDDVQNRQTHYRGHTSDVISIDVHPSGDYVATGQLAPALAPTGAAIVHVWNVVGTRTNIVAEISSRTLTRAVIVVRWSLDGKYLAAIAQDSAHSLHIFDSPMYTGGGSCGGAASLEGHTPCRRVDTMNGERVLDIAWICSEGGRPAMCAVGMHTLLFFVVDSRGWPVPVHKLVGVGRPGQASHAVVASLSFGACVTGTGRGELYMWEPPSERSTDAAWVPTSAWSDSTAGSCTALWASREFDVVFSSCADNKIRAHDFGGGAARGGVIGVLDLEADPAFGEAERGLHLASVCSLCVCTTSAVATALKSSDSSQAMGAGDGAGTLLIGSLTGAIVEVPFILAKSAPGSKDRMLTFVPRSSGGGGRSLAVMHACYGSIAALAAHPTLPRVVSGSDNGAVHLSDLASHRIMSRARYASPIAALAFSPSNGKHIAVALGRSVRGKLVGEKDACGTVLVLDASTLETEYVIPGTGQAAIHELKFAPGGAFLAAASLDTNVYIYSRSVGGAGSGNGPFALTATYRGHRHIVCSMQLSPAGVVRSTDDAGVVMLWKLVGSDNEIVEIDPDSAKDAASLSGIAYVEAVIPSWIAPVRTAVQGSGGPALNSAVASQAPRGASRGGTSGQLLAVAVLGESAVKLYDFPLDAGNSVPKIVLGHSVSVSRLCWSADNTWLVSAGSSDGALLQWRVSDDLAPLGDAAPAPSASLVSLEEAPRCALDVVQSRTSASAAAEARALKARARARCPPLPSQKRTKAPTTLLHDDFDMHWIFGLSSANCAANGLRYVNEDGAILYPAAALAVCYDPSAHTQKYLTGKHADDITVIAVLEESQGGDEAIVATGDAQSPPTVFVWSAPSMDLVFGPLRGHRKLLGLAFTPDGTILWSVGADKLFAWDLELRRAVPAARMDLPSAEITRAVTGFPHGCIVCSSTAVTTYVLDDVTCALSRWSARVPADDDFLCVEFKADSNPTANAIVAVGGLSGKLYIFDLDVRTGFLTLTQAVTSDHLHSALCIMTTCPGQARQGGSRSHSPFLWTGDSSGAVLKWDLSELSEKPTVVLPHGGMKDASLPGPQGVVALCAHSSGNKLLLATRAARAYVLEMKHERRGKKGATEEGVAKSVGGASFDATLLIDAHYRDEIWALCAHPRASTNLVVSGGADGTLRVWDTERRLVVAQATIPDSQVRCVAFHPSGRSLAVGISEVGHKSSRFYVKLLGVERLGTPHALQTQKVLEIGMKSWPEAIKYSHNQRFLAVASHDTHVYLLDIVRDYALRFKLPCKDPVVHVDFSIDSEYLQVNTNTTELIRWSAVHGKRIGESAPALRGMTWATWTCVAGPLVAAIERRGMAINVCAREPLHGKVIASGDDFGRLRLLQWPCTSPHADFVECVGHTSQITGLAWAADGAYCYTVGGCDRSLVIWKRTRGSGAHSAATRKQPLPVEEGATGRQLMRNAARRFLMIAPNGDESAGAGGGGQPVAVEPEELRRVVFGIATIEMPEFIVYGFATQLEEEAITIYSGETVVGQLIVRWEPVEAGDMRPESNTAIDDDGDDIWEAGTTPEEMYGKPWAYRVTIERAVGLPHTVCSARVLYEFMGEIFSTAPCADETTDPLFNYAAVHSVDILGDELCEWATHPLHFVLQVEMTAASVAEKEAVDALMAFHEEEDVDVGGPSDTDFSRTGHTAMVRTTRTQQLRMERIRRIVKPRDAEGDSESPRSPAAVERQPAPAKSSEEDEARGSTSDLNLSLERCCGYSSSHSSVFFLGSGAFVCHNAAVAVVCATVGSGDNCRIVKQSFYTQHTAQITCLAVHPGGDLVATGQVGMLPSIHVWSSASLECRSIIEGLHQSAISVLAFAFAGDRLASVGNDGAHTLLLYDWQREPSPQDGGGDTLPDESGARQTLSPTGRIVQPVARSLGSSGDVKEMSWDPTDSTLVAVGDEFVHFFHTLDMNGDGAWKPRKGALPDGPHCCTSVVCGSLRTVVGIEDGTLLIFVTATHVVEKVLPLCYPGMHPTNAVQGIIRDAVDPLVLWVGARGGAVWKLTGACTDPFNAFSSGGGDGGDDDAEGDEWATPELTEVFALTDTASEGEPPDVESFDVRSARGRSAPDDREFLVGAPAQIFHVAVETERARFAPIVVGHSGGTYALATHPDEPIACTGGEDGRLCMWSLDDDDCGRLMQSAYAGYPNVRAVAFSPGVEGRGSLDHLAVGFGEGGDRDGAVIIVACSTLRVASELESPHAGCSTLRYSPDARTLAVASNDCSVHLYDTEDDYSLRAKCAGAKSIVIHMDYTRDGRFLQCNTAQFELLFWNVAQGRLVQEETMRALRNAETSTWTGVLGHRVQGAWSVEPGSADLCTIARSREERAIAVGDDFGFLRLFPWPCQEQGLGSPAVAAHSDKVVCARWSCDNKHIVSVGGHDRSVFIWRAEESGKNTPGGEVSNVSGSGAVPLASTKRAVSRSELDPLLAPIGDVHGALEDEREGGRAECWRVARKAWDRKRMRELQIERAQKAAELAEQKLMGKAKKGSKKKKRATRVDKMELSSLAGPVERHPPGFPLRAMDLDLQDVKFSSHLEGPWLDASLPPSYPPAAVPALREKLPSFGMQWVMGCQAQRMRNYVHVSADGALLFATATLAVKMDVASGQQWFNTDHGTEIVAMGVSRDLERAATGEIGDNPRIVVWRTADMSTEVVLRQAHVCSVMLVDFSNRGDLLLSVGGSASGDGGRRVVVHSTRTWEVLWVCADVGAPVYDLAFRADDCSCCLVGPRDVYFLVRSDNSVASARAWRKERGTIRIDGSVAQPLTCVAYAGTSCRCVAGTLSGDLYVFDDSIRPPALVAMLHGHDAAVSCMWSHPRALVVITASVEGAVRCWNARDLSPRGASTQFKRTETPPRAICLRGGDLYVGMSSADVWIVEDWLGDGSCIDGGSEVFVPNPSAAKRRLLSCHAGSVNTVAAHPAKPLCATGGSDGTVRMWDLARYSSMPLCARTVRLRDVLPEGRTRANWPGVAVAAVAFRPPRGGELVVCLGAPDARCGAASLPTHLNGAGFMAILMPQVTGGSGDGGDAYAFKVLHPGIKIGKSWCTSLQYSPNGSLLAVGNADKSIYILDSSTGYVLRSQLVRNLQAGALRNAHHTIDHLPH